jgi:hypothetical protein
MLVLAILRNSSITMSPLNSARSARFALAFSMTVGGLSGPERKPARRGMPRKPSLFCDLELQRAWPPITGVLSSELVSDRERDLLRQDTQRNFAVAILHDEAKGHTGTLVRFGISLIGWNKEDLPEFDEDTAASRPARTEAAGGIRGERDQQ